MSHTLALFPGQASQYVGMGKDLHDNSTEVRELYAYASEQVGEDLAAISFAGPAERLKQTRFTQPAILTHSLAVWRLIGAEGRAQFTAAAGHSLGEYGALVAAGVIDDRTAIRLVARRAALMEEASQAQPGTMAALLGMEPEAVAQLCADVSEAGLVVVPANMNSTGQIAISGAVSAVEKAVALAKERGAKRALLLEVGGAFHSPLMESARAGMAAALAEVEFAAPQLLFIPNVTAEPENDPARIKELLVQQITAPVRWAETMERFNAAGVATLCEIGPGKVLSGLAKRALTVEKSLTLDTAEDIEYFLNPTPA